MFDGGSGHQVPRILLPRLCLARGSRRTLKSVSDLHRALPELFPTRGRRLRLILGSRKYKPDGPFVGIPGTASCSCEMAWLFSPRASIPIACPTFLQSWRSNVAPRPVPEGKGVGHPVELGPAISTARNSVRRLTPLHRRHAEALNGGVGSIRDAANSSGVMRFRRSSSRALRSSPASPRKGMLGVLLQKN